MLKNLVEELRLPHALLTPLFLVAVYLLYTWTESPVLAASYIGIAILAVLTAFERIRRDHLLLTLIVLSVLLAVVYYVAYDVGVFMSGFFLLVAIGLLVQYSRYSG